MASGSGGSAAPEAVATEGPASGGPEEAGPASGGPMPSLEPFKLVPSTLENGLLAYALEYTDT